MPHRASQHRGIADGPRWAHPWQPTFTGRQRPCWCLRCWHGPSKHSMFHKIRGRLQLLIRPDRDFNFGIPDWADFGQKLGVDGPSSGQHLPGPSAQAVWERVLGPSALALPTKSAKTKPLNLQIGSQSCLVACEGGLAYSPVPPPPH